jgi:hypothetical protein
MNVSVLIKGHGNIEQDDQLPALYSQVEALTKALAKAGVDLRVEFSPMPPEAKLPSKPEAKPAPAPHA